MARNEMRVATEIIVIGTSHGGLTALQTILPSLPPDFPVPICIVQHRSRDAEYGLCEYLQRRSPLKIVEPNDKDEISAGTVYLAPRDYHLMVERGSFSLSVEAPVSYARPSVDVLFESAADSYGEHVVGVILTGANADGARGLLSIKEHGGVCVVQNPEEAQAAQMPAAAIASLTHERVDFVLSVAEVANCLLRLCAHNSQRQMRHVALQVKAGE